MVAANHLEQRSLAHQGYSAAACSHNTAVVMHCVCRAVGKLDWYAQIRAYLDKEHPVFEYEYNAQRAYATKPYSAHRL